MKGGKDSTSVSIFKEQNFPTSKTKGNFDSKVCKKFAIDTHKLDSNVLPFNKEIKNTFSTANLY